jgi:hypothetical protein
MGWQQISALGKDEVLFRDGTAPNGAVFSLMNR